MNDCLKPCPFCGGNKVEIFDMRYVACKTCLASSRYCSNSEEAVAAWNRRAEPQTTVIQNGDNNVQIENCGTLNL